jgi:hypothetical protein
MAEAQSPTAIVCLSCGAKNSPSAGKRCVSCGASLTEAFHAAARGAAAAKSRQGRGHDVIWGLIALAVQSVLTAAVVIGLPMVVTMLDFEGSNGMTVAIPVWFVGGVLVGMIAPSKTYVAPGVAAFLVQVPTVLYLWRGQTVRTMPFFMYAVLGLIGVLFALVGTYLGERIQMGPPPKTAD